MNKQGLILVNLIIISICNFIIIGSKWGPNQELFGSFSLIVGMIGAGAAIILLYIAIVNPPEMEEKTT